MAEEPGWSDRFPGAAAANWVVEWLQKRRAEIDEGRINAARHELGEHGWKRNFDLNGMPSDARATVTRLVDTAWEALCQPPDVQAALGALSEAEQVCSG